MPQNKEIPKMQHLFDSPEVQSLPKETEAECKKTQLLALKIMKEIMRYRKLGRLPLMMKENGILDLLHVYEDLKKGKLKNIEMQIGFLDQAGNLQKFILGRRGVIPLYLFKNMRHYTFAEAELIQAGIFIRNNHYQLCSAVIIISSIILKYFLGQDLDNSLTIDDALRLIDDKYRDFADQFSQEENILINNLWDTIEIYEVYEKIEEIHFLGNQLKSKNEDQELIVSSIFDVFIEFFDDIEPRILELSLQKPSYYESVLANLDLTINQAIDLGVLDQYKSQAQTEDGQPTICLHHSLLNNKQLLRRLNGSSLSKKGQDALRKIYIRIDKKILDLFLLEEDLDQLIKSTKSIASAAKKLNSKYCLQIEKLIEDDRVEFNHKTYIKSENIHDRIQKILKKFKEKT